METDQLRTFTAVAHTGSFTAAARELGYVQSTVTGHVQALERRLGVRLLDRLPAGAVLTVAGARLLALATQLLDVEARLTVEVPEQQGRPAGTVRLLAPESLCAYRLPAMVARLRAGAPEIQLTLAPAGTVAVIEAIRAGACEAGLLLEPTMAAADLSLEPLGTEELALLTGPDFGWDADALTWRQLSEHDALLLEDGCSYSDEVARGLLAAGQPDSRRIHFGSVEAVKRCVAAGLGWTVLPIITSMEEIRNGDLIAHDGPLPVAPTVYLASHPGRSLGRAAQVVSDGLRALWHPRERVVDPSMVAPSTPPVTSPNGSTARPQ